MNVSTRTMNPEEKLLVSLCRLQFTDKQKSLISENIQQVTDWGNFTRLANEHGIIALTAYNLRENGFEKKIPEEKFAVLENGFRQSMVRNIWLTERRKEVNTILCNAGIKHILLKGMALEHTIYGSKGLRQMNDNDIFLNREDAIKAWYLLQQKGFTIDPVKSMLFRKIMFDIGLHLPALYKNEYAVEIHDKLFYNSVPEGNNINDPFKDAIEILIGDTKALIPSKELHLMFLVSHFEKHIRSGSCQLRLLTDIILLDETSTLRVPESFISNPIQENNLEYRKAAYKSTIRSIPPKYRLRFITGDMFPSIKWMRNRYKCSWLRAIFYYPLRAGKVLWLI
jgi:hypothetical protein